MKEKRFWKLSLGSGAVTVVRMLCAFLSNKVLALWLGPAGFACAAQLQNLLSLGQGASSLALQNGWVSLTARYRNKTSELGPVWRGGFRLTVFASLATTILLVAFGFLAPLETLFPGVPYRLVQAAVLFAVPGVAAMTVISISQSVMNGLGDYRRWALITMVSSVLQCLWVVLLLWTGSLSVLSIIATQSILSGVVAIVIAKRGGFSYARFQKGMPENFRIWGGFALMGLVPAILSPLILTAVRSFLGEVFGWKAAGLWQGAYRISDFFNVGLSSVLGVLLLPQFSAMKTQAEFRTSLHRFLRRVLALAFPAVLILFVLRRFVVSIVLSGDFSALGDFLPIQLVGDFFRSGNWCLGLALVSRQATRAFLTVEVLSELLFGGLTFAGVSFFGIQAPFLAYAVENFLCFALLLIVTRKMPWKDL